MDGSSVDIAHLLAGSMVLVSFMLLYQDRMFGVLNVFALHAFVVSLSVAWQAYVQHAPYLYVTAVIALLFKALIIPVALHRLLKRRLSRRARIESLTRSRSAAMGAGTTSSPTRRSIASSLGARIA